MHLKAAFVLQAAGGQLFNSLFFLPSVSQPDNQVFFNNFKKYPVFLE